MPSSSRWLVSSCHWRGLNSFSLPKRSYFSFQSSADFGDGNLSLSKLFAASEHHTSKILGPSVVASFRDSPINTSSMFDLTCLLTGRIRVQSRQTGWYRNDWIDWVDSQNSVAFIACLAEAKRLRSKLRSICHFLLLSGPQTPLEFSRPTLLRPS